MKINKDWLKKNKKKILFVGSGFVMIVAGVIAYKHREGIINYICNGFDQFDDLIVNDFEMSNIVVVNDTNKVKSINVTEHIRNLPNGFHPSIGQLELAECKGIKLNENQTLVSSYVRCY